MVRMKTLFLAATIQVLALAFTHVRAQESLAKAHVFLQYKQALHLVGEQRYEQAIAALKQIIGQASSFSRPYLKLIEVYKYRNDLDAARSFFLHIVDKSPENSRAYHALGLIYRDDEEYGQAYDSILRALQLDPDYAAAYPDFVTVNKELESAKNALEEILQARPEGAAAHYGLAYIFGEQSKFEAQLREAKRALQLRPGFLEASWLIADAHYSLGKYEKALAACNLGIERADHLGDIEQRIEFMNLMAFVLYKMGDASRAIELLDQTLKMTHEIGDKDKEGETLNNFARIHWYASDYGQARQYAREALRIETGLRDTRGQAVNFNYLAIFSAELGDYSMALEYFRNAREQFLQVGEKGTAAICTGNMAGVYIRLGDELQAIAHFGQALATLSGMGKKNAEAAYLSGMGEAYERLGNVQQASSHYLQALAIVQEMPTQGHLVSQLLGKIGGLYQELGDYSQARAYYEQALDTDMRIFDKLIKAQNLIKIGGLYLSRKEYAKSRKFFQEALTIGEETGDVMVTWRAQAGLGRLLQAQDRYDEALQRFKRAIETLEHLRGRLRTDEERTGFAKDKIELYGHVIEILAERNDDSTDKADGEQALVYAEKAKARAFLDVVYEGRIFHRLSEIPASFRQEFLITEQALEKKHSELSQELAKGEAERDDRYILERNDEIEALQRQRRQLLEEIKQKFPRYHQLTNPRILTAVDVQREILTDSQILFEYFVTQKSVFVWILTKNRLKFHTIDLSRKDLEEKLALISPLFQREKPPTEGRVDHRWANFRPGLLHELYQTLFLEPGAGLFKPGMEIVIVPDDILFYLPFEILVTNSTADRVHYLIETHPISYAASMSLLNPELQKGGTASEQLLALGNPDFDTAPNKGVVEWLGTLSPLGSVFRGGRFQPLPHAATEVKTIARNFEHPTVLTGVDASEERFKAWAQNHKFIHLATHNVVDNMQPMYSKIILSQKDKRGEDGLLQTYEVYNLRLNAHLVVLSGCDTGLGKLSRGEGLVGMSRAFLYAGAKSLVVSLWPVNDESTAELMNHFYQNLRKGMAKNRALQQAKIKLLKSKDWRRDPFYWGAFVLMGDCL
ncbi:MAG: CHAT domain-containing protein [bacterium]